MKNIHWIFVALLLTGCSDRYMMSNVKAFRPADTPMDVAYVESVEEFKGACRGDHPRYGCAVVPNDWAYNIGYACKVYIVKGSPKWVLGHEKRHCMGEAHRPGSTRFPDGG